MGKILVFINGAVVLALTLFALYLGLYPREPQVGAMPSLAIVLLSVAGLLVFLHLTPLVFKSLWPPVEFYPNRSTLAKAHGSIAERLKNIDKADAIWVLGQKFYHASEDTHKIRRLLLPDPASDAFKFHTSTGHDWSAEATIADITKLAKQCGAEVRWYDHFIFHSLILADTNKRRGWVHSESVFPHSTNERRPSYTIYRRNATNFQ
jgi:hypothetical protein